MRTAYKLLHGETRQVQQPGLLPVYVSSHYMPTVKVDLLCKVAAERIHKYTKEGQTKTTEANLIGHTYPHTLNCNFIGYSLLHTICNLIGHAHLHSA